MTDQEKRVFIAERCGWCDLLPGGEFDVTGTPLDWANSGVRYHRVPDYLTDLNAMAEAEKVLTDKQHDAFQNRLIWVVERDTDSNKRLRYVSATARQRADAFIAVFKQENTK